MFYVVELADMSAVNMARRSAFQNTNASIFLVRAERRGGS